MKTYYDIAVIGGGVAGVAAAVQAARCGMKTVLVERTALVGGLATGGLINVFLPLCDGNGHQVTFGIAEEMLRKSIVYGPGEIPPNWKKERNGMERKRFIAVFSPASFVLALDEMLDEAGVDVWLDSLVCDVRIDPVDDFAIERVQVNLQTPFAELRDIVLARLRSGLRKRRTDGCVLR